MRDHSEHLHKKLGEISPGLLPMVAKMCFFLLHNQRGILATYSAPISTIFETIDLNQCVHVYTGEKFLNFCTGVYLATKTKTPKKGLF